MMANQCDDGKCYIKMHIQQQTNKKNDDDDDDQSSSSWFDRIKMSFGWKNSGQNKKTIHNRKEELDEK